MRRLLVGRDCVELALRRGVVLLVEQRAAEPQADAFERLRRRRLVGRFLVDGFLQELDRVVRLLGVGEQFREFESSFDRERQIGELGE